MSNKLLFFLPTAALATLLAISSGARASLTLGAPGIVYDNVLNIMWLQDANYAVTSGYQTSWGAGRMTWEEAHTWVDQLVFGIYDDWRLATSGPVNGISFNYAYSDDGSTDYARNISYPGQGSDPPSEYPGSTQNELAFMYHNNLGLLSDRDIYGVSRSGTTGVDYGLTHQTFTDYVTGETHSFINLMKNENLIIPNGYWLGNEININSASTLHFSSGFNDSHGKTQHYFAWAVRDFTPVPLPPSLAMFLSALVTLVAIRQQRNSRPTSFRFLYSSLSYYHFLRRLFFRGKTVAISKAKTNCCVSSFP